MRKWLEEEDQEAKEEWFSERLPEGRREREAAKEAAKEVGKEAKRRGEEVVEEVVREVPTVRSRRGETQVLSSETFGQKSDQIWRLFQNLF